MWIGVCLKWVDLRPEIDPLTGSVAHDERWFGASPADHAALETALALARGSDDRVLAITAGPTAADAVLRQAAAVGADRLVRVGLDPEAASATVATAMAPVLRAADTAVVMCGDWSLDRGSGSVPAYLAHELHAAQALGCVSVEREARGLKAQRRLDRGRREHLQLALPAVVSVEAGAAELRRASLAGVLAAGRRGVEVIVPGVDHEARVRLVDQSPYRARSKELPPPEGGDARARVLSLTGALTGQDPPRPIEIDPDTAAGMLLDRLAGWGVAAVDPVEE